MDAILFWNQVCLDANKIDFSTENPEADPAPQQGGPTRTSRAMAIVHLAMYDAYSGFTGGPLYLMYSNAELPGIIHLLSARAAVAAAACATLNELYSKQRDALVKKFVEFMTALGQDDPAAEPGLAWGRLVAAKMLNERRGDGSEAPDDFYAPSSEPGKHRVDPLNPGQKFLGPLWGRVKPFGINNITDPTVITTIPPPPLNSAAYTTDFNQVRTMGALHNPTRSPQQTARGLYWAYDGARNIGVPPRLYNQVVRAIAEKAGTGESLNAKLFAMVNVAMADAGIQAWHEKYIYNFWRPVVGIREAEEGWGPSGKGDGNLNTQGDPYWLPLGAPRTNQPQKPSVTPNFPAYPSGHATFGTVALRMAELVLGLPPTFAFNFVSDELNGQSIDRDGSIRSRYNGTMTIADAIEENILSRVYLGVHWEFDGREGERNGNQIATKIAAAFPAKA